MQKKVITWNRSDRKVSYCRAMASLSPISRESLLYALVQVLPACLQTPLRTRLPSRLYAPPTPRGPALYAHCLESGVTFSMSSMKFFRNSVLLSEAFKSLQYSLGVGRGKKSGLGELRRAEGSRLPDGLPGRWLRSPGCREGRECSHRLWSP